MTLEEKLKQHIAKLKADRDRIVTQANAMVSVLNDQIAEIEKMLGVDVQQEAPTMEPEKGVSGEKPAD